MGLFTRKKKSKDLITPLPPPSPPPDDFLVHQHAPPRPPQQQTLGGPPPLAHQPQQHLLQQPPRLAHRQQQQSFVPLSTSRPRSRQLGRERVDSGPGGRAQWEGGAEEAGWDRRAPTVQQPFQDTLDLPPSLPPSRSRSPSPLPLPPPPRSQDHSTPSVLSEKALGKRRVIDAFEADEVFDPDDIYKTQDDRLPKRAPSPPSSDTDLELQDGWVPPKPVRYIYDAAEEHKQLREEERVREALRSLRLARGLGSSAFADDDPSPPPPPLPPPKPPQEEVVPPSRRLPKGLSQEREMARLLGAAGGTHTPPGGATTRDLDGEGGAAALGRKLSFWRRGGQSVPSHRSASRDSSGLGLGE